jgi:hypothetical protein
MNGLISIVSNGRKILFKCVDDAKKVICKLFFCWEK